MEVCNNKNDLKFIIFGDIGHSGDSRALVADVAAKLQKRWKDDGETLATFVLTTGDNVYDTADELAFESIQQEMLDKLPLPWYFCLGNHDVKTKKYEWHRNKDGMVGQSGWEWHCPAPAYTIPADTTMSMVDIHVINTNKLTKGIIKTSPPGPAPAFYTSNTNKWWREQRLSLEAKLRHRNQDVRYRGQGNRNRLDENAASKRWQIVVGHHPAEYVYLSLKEHGLWGIRYFPTTFMRGGPMRQRERNGLAYILRKEADLYLCGHQHLSAYMQLVANGKYRHQDEERCLFAIVGNSSKLDQDEEDFDNDFIESKPYQIEENVTEESPQNTQLVNAEAIKKEKTLLCKTVNHLKSPDLVRERTLSTTDNPRYKKEWCQAHTCGFAVAYVTEESFKLVFIEVYPHGGFREAKSVNLKPSLIL